MFFLDDGKFFYAVEIVRTNTQPTTHRITFKPSLEKHEPVLSPSAIPIWYYKVDLVDQI
jgi:hypothetical protein